MENNNLKDLEIMDNIKFMIKYCDTFLDYCHEENLSIDGNIAGEIVDSITEIEDYLDSPEDELTEDDILTIYQQLSEIYDSLLNLNDIKLFNTIHIVYSNILKESKEKLEKQLNIEIDE